MKDKQEALKKRIQAYLNTEQLSRKEDHKQLEKPFLAKARKNYTVANLLYRISEEDEAKRLLKLPADFEIYEWVIIVSYYSMYTASLAALARLGFRTKSHAATITVLQHHYVNPSRLDVGDIHKLSKAYVLSEQLILKLIQTKTRRETAQYEATASITREMARSALKDAEEFITKVEEVLSK